MDFKIEKKTENVILNRTEIEFSADSGSVTPSRKDVRSAVQQNLKVDEDLIVVDRIDSVYGTTKVVGRALVYKDKESLKLEPKYKLKRDSKGAGKADAPKEAPAEKPAEPKKEEAKPEERKPELKKEEKAEKPAEEKKPEPKKEEAKAEPAEKKAEKEERKG